MALGVTKGLFLPYGAESRVCCIVLRSSLTMYTDCVKPFSDPLQDRTGHTRRGRLGLAIQTPCAECITVRIRILCNWIPQILDYGVPIGEEHYTMGERLDISRESLIEDWDYIAEASTTENTHIFRGKPRVSPLQVTKQSQVRRLLYIFL